MKRSGNLAGHKGLSPSERLAAPNLLRGVASYLKSTRPFSSPYDSILVRSQTLDKFRFFGWVIYFRDLRYLFGIFDNPPDGRQIYDAILKLP